MIWIWVAFGIAALVFIWVLSRRVKPMNLVKRELRAIENAGKMKKEIARRGLEVARKDLEAQYVREIEQFDAMQRVQFHELRNDPVALSKWLTRLSG